MGKMQAITGDSSAWLPARAESTQVLDLQSRFQSPNIVTGVVVYARPSGLTSADRAKAVTDARRFAGVTGVVPGQAATGLRTTAQANAGGLSVRIAGPLGSAADSNCRAR